MSADLAPNNSILFILQNYMEVECELGFVGAIVNDPISLILCSCCKILDAEHVCLCHKHITLRSSVS